uniref:Uncharacterized protein n=1 Tax=Meloidogyne enterolobii TaxID=390850 RepID=A0A6V7VZ82_MELEN|nr:unnamed protein product [Meloidogyne enterolobii]
MSSSSDDEKTLKESIGKQKTAKKKSKLRSNSLKILYLFSKITRRKRSLMLEQSFTEIIQIAKEAAPKGSNLRKTCLDRVKKILANGFTTKENFKKAFDFWKILNSITMDLDNPPIMFKERIKWPEGEWTHFRSSADFVVAFWRIFDTDPIAVVTAAAGRYSGCEDVKNEINSKIGYYADSDLDEDDFDVDQDAPRHQQRQQERYRPRQRANALKKAKEDDSDLDEDDLAVEVLPRQQEHKTKGSMIVRKAAALAENISLQTKLAADLDKPGGSQQTHNTREVLRQLQGNELAISQVNDETKSEDDSGSKIEVDDSLDFTVAHIIDVVNDQQPKTPEDVLDVEGSVAAIRMDTTGAEAQDINVLLDDLQPDRQPRTPVAKYFPH